MDSRTAIFTLVLIFAFVFPAFSQEQSAQLKKANKIYELNDFPEAVEAYRKVLQKEPENVEALSKMADCYRMLDQLLQAEQLYRKAITLRGVNPIHIFNLGKVLMALGQYDEARQWFLNYAEAYPGYGNHYAEACEEAKRLQTQEVQYDIKQEYINSTESDFAPAFFKAGVVFASSRKDIPLTGQRNKVKVELGKDNQLFFSGVGGNGFLTKPVFHQSEIRHDKNEGPVSFSADGRWVAFTKNNFKSGIRQIPAAGLELSIYIASVDAEGNWGNAVPFTYNGSGFSSGYPCFSDNGNTLFFASDRADGYGGFDIFVSRKVGSLWSEPQNLGPAVNSAGNEISPFFDGYNIFFASDWHAGLGGFDIFKASFENNGWNKVVNMGKGINSPRDDYGLIYSSDNNIGYFVSNRPGGKGKEDIYHYAQITDRLEIIVLDGLTSAPVPEAEIDFSACGEPSFKTDRQGRYSFQALQGLDCQVTVKKAGYAPFSFDLKSESNKPSIEVKLFSENTQYLGRVVNVNNNMALEDVLVRATNQNSGGKTETTTNPSGEYVLALLPQTNYIIKFSKAGYLDVNTAINTRSGTNRNLLGTVTLQPASTLVDDGSFTPPQPAEDTGTRPPSGNQGNAETLSQGYAVQVAAIFNSSRLNMNEYQQLRSIGNVYKASDAGAIKIRVGIYPSYLEAEAARRRIQQQGFSSAFVVTEKVDSEKKDVLLETSKGGGYDDGGYQDDLVDRGGSQQPYKVQLASYKNPAFFDGSKVERLGVIEERIKGPYTVMFLSGYSSATEARRARDEAVRAGFRGAFVVMESGGQLVRVR